MDQGEKGRSDVLLKTQNSEGVTCYAYKGVLKGILEKTNHVGSVKIKSYNDDFCEYEIRY
ncbi:MAG: hypothetical protein ACQEQM_05810 [Thermoplasmatota archaeon]